MVAPKINRTNKGLMSVSCSWIQAIDLKKASSLSFLMFSFQIKNVLTILTKLSAFRQ